MKGHRGFVILMVLLLLFVSSILLGYELQQCIHRLILSKHYWLKTNSFILAETIRKQAEKAINLCGLCCIDAAKEILDSLARSEDDRLTTKAKQCQGQIDTYSYHYTIELLPYQHAYRIHLKLYNNINSAYFTTLSYTLFGLYQVWSEVEES